MINVKKLLTIAAVTLAFSPLAFADDDVTVSDFSTSNTSYNKAFYSQNGGNVAGNVNGKVTVIDFFDYRCPDCRKAQKELVKMIKDNKDLRVVYIDYPVLGDPSVVAAKAAFAAMKQNKYLPLHDALMSDQSPLTTAEIYKVAKNQGIDVAQLKKDMADEAIDKKIDSHLDMGKDLNVNFVPTFIIGNTKEPHQAKMYVGSDTDKMKDMIKNLEG